MNNLIKDHNHAVPLMGGPLCGESMTIEGYSLPKNLPMFYDKHFYVYVLNVIENQDSFEVFYRFSNITEKLTQIKK
jgi:hypothetical protein